MRCQRCGGMNRRDAVFCSGCGFRLERRCPACGNGVEPGDRFCASCGSSLQPGPGAATPLLGASGERKRVTVVFADLAGSTELVDRTDPEEAAGHLRAAVSAMSEAVHRYGGTVNEVRGDGIMALFGAPLAVEDHAVRACYSAIDMPELVAEATGGSGRVRVGMHTGEVLVRTISNDIADGYVAVGSTVHLAARMEQMADPGVPLATTATVRLAEGFVRFETRGLVRVRGFDEPVEVCAITGRTDRTGSWANRVRRQLTTFVGRGPEVELLEGAAEQVRRGTGVVYLIEGAPGVGKSRLLYEFTRRLPADTDVIQAQASPYDVSTPYYVVRQLVKHWLETQGGGGADLVTVLADLDPGLAEVVPLVAFVLGDPAPGLEEMDSVRRRRAVAEGLRAVFEAAARRRDIVFAVEDLHWIDETSMSVFSDMLTIAETAPVMAVATHRPEFQSRWEKPWLRRIKLDTLDRVRGRLLLDALLGDHPSVQDLKRMVLERASGTPLFFEELVRSLVEVGALVGEPGDRRLVAPIEQIDLPDGVSGVIAERIDRLDASTKHMLQVAAVIGEDVSVEILASVAGMEPEMVDRSIEALRVSEFMYERASAPVRELTFRHNLTREVAYSGIPMGVRRMLHGAVLDVMREAGILGEQVERSARHARFAERWEEAADLALEAARRSEERSAYADAIRYLRWAREALPWVEPTEDRLRQRIDAAIALRTSHTGAGQGMDEVLSALDEAERLAERIGDQHRVALVNLHRAYLCSTIGRYSQGLPSARKAAVIADAAGARLIAADARIAEAQCMTQAGYGIGVEEVLRPQLPFILSEMRTERLGMVGNRGVWALLHLGTAMGLQGRFTESDRYLDEAGRIVGETDRPFDLGYLTWVRGIVAYIRERPDDGIRMLGDAVAIASRYEMRWQEAWAEVFLVYGLIASRRLSEAAASIEKIMARVERLGAPAVEAWARFHAGLLALRSHRPTEAEPHLRAALDWGLAAESPTIIVDANRYLARLDPDDLPRAERHLEAAASEAARAGLRPFLARTRHEWAFVLSRHGRHDQAARLTDEANLLRDSMGLPRF